MQASVRHQIARQIALKAAERAATIMHEHRTRGNLEIASKKNNHRDLVTAADTAAEREIIRTIGDDWPEESVFLSEETNAATQLATLGGRALWIIDPIDGTVNYARGHLHAAVSIAVAWEDTLQVGVVASPFEGEVFHAVRGGGAYCNGTRIASRPLETIQGALVATGFPVNRDPQTVRLLTNRIQALLAEVHDFRRAGAASLDTCWVACGRLDAYYEDVSPWDIAAGALIAREAGARVGHYDRWSTDLKGLEEELRGKHFLVSAPAIFEALAQKLASASSMP